jgi:hypothetical protein
VRFEIDSNPAEAQRACAAIARAMFPPTRFVISLLVLYACVWAASMYFTPATRTATAIIAIASIVAAVLLLQFDLQSRGRSAQARDPHAHETHYVELSADGVRTWCAHVDARLPWADFSRVLDTPEFLLFARPSGVGVAVPKRLIKAEEIETLLAQTQTWAPTIEIDRLKR